MKVSDLVFNVVCDGSSLPRLHSKIDILNGTMLVISNGSGCYEIIIYNNDGKQISSQTVSGMISDKWPTLQEILDFYTKPLEKVNN